MNRRLFIGLTGALLVSPLSIHAPIPVRRIRLLNSHTRESFDGPYRDENGPIVAAMEDLSFLLRDHYSGERTAIDIGVIDFLAAVMDAVGVSRAVVISAYRSATTNEALARTTFGVAENSQHLYGRALDIHLENRLQQAMETARAMNRGGVGWYPHAGFMHIDTGPVRNWTLDGKDLARVMASARPEASNSHRSNSTNKPRSGLLVQRSRRNLFGSRTISSTDDQQLARMQRVLDDLLVHRVE